MIALGFAGTAKNTGKTTTALHVLDLCQRAGVRVGLTSIGYDGENIDTITGLSKPRYSLPAGTLAATALGCLSAGSAVCQVLNELPVQTVLGRVALVEVTRPGSVVLAGPNSRKDLRVVVDAFDSRRVDVGMIDGALNRTVPLVGANGLILSTGAAFDPDINVIASHAGAAAELFSLFTNREWSGTAHQIRVECEGQESLVLPTGSLFSCETLNQIGGALAGTHPRVLIPGACSPSLLDALLKEYADKLEGARFTLGGPLRMMAAGDPRRWQHIILTMRKSGQHLDVIDPTPLRAITVNPFYPRYLSAGRYQPAEVNKDALLVAVRAAAGAVQVINIIEEDLVLDEILHLMRRIDARSLC